MSGLDLQKRKHPHGCGEDNGDIHLGIYGNRNTPTGVGKTMMQTRNDFATRKHPHGCGEDFLYVGISNPPKETPPRVWGRLRTGTGTLAHARNTPTGVGKTPGSISSGLEIRKHPHGCGEDFRFQRSGRSSPETPPRVWGRPIIQLKRDTDRQKHPHGCGEDA